MDEQKRNLFLDRLLEKTEKKELDWQTTIKNTTFLVGLKDTAISVTKENDEFYSFDFRDDMGNIVDLVIISKKDFPAKEFEDTEFDKAKKIFDLARRQSLKPEQTVDRILEELAA